MEAGRSQLEFLLHSCYIGEPANRHSEVMLAMVIVVLAPADGARWPGA